MKDPFPPRCAAQYHHIKQLAEGGFGTVHLARQVKLNREVVIKLLHGDGVDDPDIVTRFRTEAKVTASLSHPAIVSVIDHDMEGGVPWIAYEYLPGRGLDHVLRAGALPWRTVLDVGVQIAEALQEAHAHGVLHRDVKPANIMEAGPGQWKLTDFGVARWTQVTRMLTRTGEVVGTMGYIAPELLTGGEPSPSNDVFALGVTLFELLLGHHPYEGNIIKLLQLKAAGDEWIAPPSERVPGVPAGLDAAIARAIRREPGDRFASAGELARSLRQVVAPRASKPVVTPRAVGSTDPRSGVERLKPWMIAAAFTGVGILIGGGAMWAVKRPAKKAPPRVAATGSTAAPARVAMDTATKLAIHAALVADAEYMVRMRPRMSAFDKMLVGSLSEKLPEIAREAVAIRDLDAAASAPLIALQSKLPPSLAASEIEPQSADLARRLSKAILWHANRVSRFRQTVEIAQQQLKEGGDNIFGSPDFALALSQTGHERSCLEPARRWVQHAITHLDLFDATAGDEPARSLGEDLDHFGRFLAPITWHVTARDEWVRLARPLNAALARKGDAVHDAYCALWRERIEASWPRKTTTPEARARMEAHRVELERLVPKWRHTLAHLRHVIAR